MGLFILSAVLIISLTILIRRSIAFRPICIIMGHKWDKTEIGFGLWKSCKRCGKIELTKITF